MGMAIQVCEHCNAAGQQIEGSKLSHLTKLLSANQQLMYMLTSCFGYFFSIKCYQQQMVSSV